MREFSSKSARLVGYFPAEARKQNYSVEDIPAEQLTHIIYAFAGLKTDGSCYSIDKADDDQNFPLLVKLKEHYPNLQLLISIGGASNENFPGVAGNQENRLTFVKSAVQFMTENGFDGIDIDWEFPGASDSTHFTTLLRELRNQLDTQSEADGRHYLLTISAPAGQSHYKYLQLPQIHAYLAWINLMTYNFTSVLQAKITDFVGPLKAYDPTILDHATHNVDFAVKAYLKAGVPADKIVVGVRFVGNGWTGVPPANDGLYQRPGGAAPGSWGEAGSLGFQDIEDNYLPTYTYGWQNEAQVPWLYNPGTGIMISYEDPDSVTAKANYVLANQLGGIMIWELAADDAEHTLVSAIAAVLA